VTVPKLLLRIDANDPRPLYVQLMDDVRRAIATAVIRAGDAVPSIRQLAGDLRINPLTVKQAYDQLEREGVLAVRRGLGTFVSDSVSLADARDDVARAVADRALRDAHRHGLGARALLTAIREAVLRDEARTPSKARQGAGR